METIKKPGWVRVEQEQNGCRSIIHTPVPLAEVIKAVWEIRTSSAQNGPSGICRKTSGGIVPLENLVKRSI